jgi:hypothetical protein
MVQRLCGICPVSHHLAASKALDMILGAKQLTPTAEKMRRLMHYGQILQSHALHFFHLSSPDLLFGFDSDVAARNIVGVAAAHPEVAKKGVLLRKYGQEVIRMTAGKRVHGTGSMPGGVNKSTLRRGARRAAQGSTRWWPGAAKRWHHPRPVRAEPRRATTPSAASAPPACAWCAPTAPWTSTTAACARATSTASPCSTTSTTPLLG